MGQHEAKHVSKTRIDQEQQSKKMGEHEKKIGERRKKTEEAHTKSSIEYQAKKTELDSKIEQATKRGDTKGVERGKKKQIADARVIETQKKKAELYRSKEKTHERKK